MLIAVATENTPKINACKRVIHTLFANGSASAEPVFFFKKTDPGVGSMPLSTEEMMRGARNRAINLFESLRSSNKHPAFSIGLEGGIFFKYVPGNPGSEAFLESWVYVFNGRKGSWGSSGAVPLPGQISRPIVEKNVELAVVIDEITKKKNIRSKQGAVGILTKGRISRQQFFERALYFAFAPFVNDIIYSQED